MTAAQFDSAQFDYEFNPELFLGRSGGGPLWVVWDTNILITYLQHGEALWGDAELLVTEHERDEVEALGALMNLWVWRDIRWRVLERTLTDAQRELRQSNYERSLTAMEEIAAALAFGGREWDEPVGAGYSVSSGSLGILMDQPTNSISPHDSPHRHNLWVPESRSWVLSCTFAREVV